MDLLAYMLAASGDDVNLKFWFWLIVGVIFLIKKVVESLKPKEKDEEIPTLEAEDHHEKRVKEIIEEMRRTTHPPQPQAPARSLHPAPPSVELPTPAVARKRRAEPHPKPERTAETTAPQPVQNVLEYHVKATEEARQSIHALSDAEQAALHRLQEREMKESHPEPSPAPTAAAPLSLKNSLRHSQSLREAILYQEILGKPRALRGISFSGE